MPNNKIMERKIKKEFSIAVSVDSAYNLSGVEKTVAGST